MSGGIEPTRVAVALSGGVDSAVAAALLVGHAADVVGMTLRLQGDDPGPPIPSPKAVERARTVCQQLRIPHHVIDVEKAFANEVVDYFVTEYATGRTPNPCVRCNQVIRFGLMMEYALDRGADALATGHYARTSCRDGEYLLLRGQDSAKDQSYFLHALSQSQLARARFPLGTLTKEQVRAMASELGLPVANQPESQDVCFLVDGDYRRFINLRAPEVMRPGPILDLSGEQVGWHQGLPGYTIGQRKGLGLSSPEPLYVLALEPDENTLVVGSASQLGRQRCRLRSMHYIGTSTPDQPFRAQAQIRYRAPPVAATVYPMGDEVADVEFDEAQQGVAPGQFLVLYEGDIVLGGGVICRPQDSML